MLTYFLKNPLQFQILSIYSFLNLFFIYGDSFVGVTAYGYAFYTAVCRNEAGYGVPIFHGICSEDSGPALAKVLQVIRTHAANNGDIFCPRSWMVDKDTKEHGALAEVFPESEVLFFH